MGLIVDVMVRIDGCLISILDLIVMFVDHLLLMLAFTPAFDPIRFDPTRGVHSTALIGDRLFVICYLLSMQSISISVEFRARVVIRVFGRFH
jgi:hypothetical protein